MTAEHYGAIVNRARTALGPEWEVAPVALTGPLTWTTARPVPDNDADDPPVFSWDPEDDAQVAIGLGDVLLVGKVCGYDVFDQGTMDEMLALVVKEWIKRKDKPKRGWFGR